MHGKVGHYHEFADFVYCPTNLCFFNQMHMSLKNQGGIINIGTYNDNSREYNIDARGTNVSDLVRTFMADDIIPAEDSALSEKDQANTTNNAKSAADYQNILPIPRKGKYTEVRRYIEERCKFDQEFKTFVENHSRVELCMRLTDEFGWDVDEHALGVNMNRNR